MINQFGKKIKELRNVNHLRQKQVANELGIDTALLCKIEKGERIAKRDTIPEFARVLNTKSEELKLIWLADQLYEIVKDENNPLEAMSIAEKLLGLNTK